MPRHLMRLPDGFAGDGAVPDIDAGCQGRIDAAGPGKSVVGYQLYVGKNDAAQRLRGCAGVSSRHVGNTVV